MTSWQSVGAKSLIASVPLSRVGLSRLIFIPIFGRQSLTMSLLSELAIASVAFVTFGLMIALLWRTTRW